MNIKPNSYPAGLRGAPQDQPVDGTTTRVRASHHTEVINRQRAAFRGYPAVQGIGMGVITTAQKFGLFVMPPGAKSLYVHFKTIDVFTSTLFSVSHNGVTLTETRATESATFYQASAQASFSFGPFNLSSGGGGDETLVGYAQFQVGAGSINVYDLWYSFSINTT
mgnify:CR=1 FL=1